jgi:hypothetical protein
MLVLTAGLGLVVVARRRQQAAVRLESAQAMVEAVVGPPAIPVPQPAPKPSLAGDENVPRWRRPSVAAARYGNGNTSTIRSGMADSMIRTRPTRVFAEPTEVIGERLVVRYGVPLLNQPDEAFGRVLENLGSGDQVEILDHGEIWANVITPTGAAGWVPSATLGPTAGRRAGDGEDAAHAPEPGESPQVAEPPTLEALLEAARRARMDAGHQPVTDANESAGQAPPAPDDGQENGPVDQGGPTDGDGRRARPRRRPKPRSTARRT